ncbi:Uma2 family endonuclease [Neolewinella antarctica]|uniref:Uma2 family endonuclease n=1 Tax=Neolewinella antarctica TaxID=442734 RepID=A0ABX0XG30_9BACT|nr:Uma2 family endonuclease [Neolewinella antarctica]NJC27738.1 Uma2 family endonuclease [Neolewinella antarctica]
MTNKLEQPGLISDFNWPLERYHKAIASGVLGPEDNLELLNGKLVKKASINPPHAAGVTRVTKFFTERYFGKFELRAENPVTFLDDSEPEPDFALCDLSEDEYFHQHPIPSEVRLIVEVADNSLQRDRSHKAAIYAFAGVQEYWIVNLRQRQVEVYTDPDVTEGIYGQVIRYKVGEQLRSPFVGEVKVKDLIPG